MSEIPKSPYEILTNDTTTKILDKIVVEAKTRFNFQLISNDAIFGHSCHINTPTITQGNSEKFILEITEKLQNQLSNRVKGALLSQRRYQGLDGRAIQVEFNFTELRIWFQDQPQACIGVYYRVKPEVKS